MLRATFPYAASERLLSEYLTVLSRPTLTPVHGLTASEIDILLTDLAQNAIVLAPRRVRRPPISATSSSGTSSPFGTTSFSSPVTSVF